MFNSMSLTYMYFFSQYLGPVIVFMIKESCYAILEQTPVT